MFQEIARGIVNVAFPDICYICGRNLGKNEHTICIDCLTNRFPTADSSGEYSSAEMVLPDAVKSQTALWNFDKGGILQEALHQLKYERLTGIGKDFGKALGWHLKKHPVYSDKIMNNSQMVIVPVPLHHKKLSKRGYNQARCIAEGVKGVINTEIVPQKAVIRTKNTKTQTGFTLEQRRENLYGAFEAAQPSFIKNCLCLIVDDVFTTGATTFELAHTLIKAGARNTAIVTVAQA